MRFCWVHLDNNGIFKMIEKINQDKAGGLTIIIIFIYFYWHYIQKNTL